MGKPITSRKHYRTWYNMVARCHSESHKSYSNYGGRGIVVHGPWRDSPSAFIEWLEENLGPRPDGFSLDRIDNSTGYFPGNLRWASKRVQVRNSRSARILSYKGETLCLSDWSEKTGLSVQCISYRLKKGWAIEDALLVPKGSRRPQAKPRKRYSVDGASMTVAEMAKAAGLKVDTVYNRLSKGDTPKQAMRPLGDHKKLLTVGGVTRNLTEWAIVAGVCRSTITYRIQNGMTPEQVVRRATQ